MVLYATLHMRFIYVFNPYIESTTILSDTCAPIISNNNVSVEEFVNNTY